MTCEGYICVNLRVLWVKGKKRKRSSTVKSDANAAPTDATEQQEEYEVAHVIYVLYPSHKSYEE